MSLDADRGGGTILQKSKLHLDEVQESYWSHAGFALYAVWTMLSATILLLIHILVPAWFQCSASNRILKLAQDMKTRRDRAGQSR